MQLKEMKIAEKGAYDYAQEHYEYHCIDI